jgi:hypothetical protein
MGFELEKLKEIVNALPEKEQRLTSLYQEVIEVSNDREAAIKTAAEGQIDIGYKYLDDHIELHYSAEQTGSEPFDLDTERAAMELIAEGLLIYAAVEVIEYLKGGARTEAASFYITNSHIDMAEERRRYGTEVDLTGEEDEIERPRARRGANIRSRGW